MRNLLLFLLVIGNAGLAYGQNPVTFRVDLSVKAAEGWFDPAVHTVEARGAFNGWTSGFQLTDPDANLVYEGVYDLPDTSIGTGVDYKFVVVKGVPNDNWESDPNRSFTLSAGGTTLPTVFFDRDSTVSVPVNAAIAFEVDLNVQTFLGRFDPLNNHVYVRGSRTGWGEPPDGFLLSEDAERPGVYSGVFRVANILTGDATEYKYTIWNDVTRQTTWEGGDNKKVFFDGSEPDTDGDTYLEKNVGLTFFDGVTFNDILGGDTEVTFRVDMNGAQQQNGTPFDPATQGVWINAAFIPWWTWGTSPADYRMFDDGSNGDEVGGDLIYSWKHVFHPGDILRLEYKYGILSADNEAAFGNNHIRFIRQTGSYLPPVDTFGTMFKEAAPIGSLSIALTDGGKKVALSWNGGPGIRLQRCNSLVNAQWADVPGTDGLSGLELSLESGNQFYRLIRQ